MRRLILGAIAAVTMAIGVSGGAFASPAYRPYDGGPNPNAVRIQRIDYYWNHHRYHHRDWDRDHHRWHYYD